MPDVIIYVYICYKIMTNVAPVYSICHSLPWKD